MIGGLSASDFEVICNRASEADTKDAEPKPKFQVGDKVEIDNLLSAYDGKVGTIARILIGETVNYCVKIQNDIITVNEDSLSPYTDPTAEERDRGLSKYATGQTVLLQPVGSFHKIKSICYRDNKFIYTMESGLEFEENVLSPLPESVSKIELTPDWQSYRMELAAKLAVAYAEKGRYVPEEIGAKAVEVANGVVEQLKNGKV